MDAAAVVPVGTVGRAHGVRGWVRVRSDMEPAEELLRHDTWLVDARRRLATGERPLGPAAGKQPGGAS